VPALLLSELRRSGLGEDRVQVELSELEAARSLLAWARPGDVLVLPVHGAEVLRATRGFAGRAHR
jgi:UDP-N-acetylmuramyl tripeptide synthase